MSHKGTDGIARGFVVDVLNEAARRENITVEWVLTSSAPDADLKNGTIDLLPSGFVTTSRRNAFHVTKAWWTLGFVALVPQDGPIHTEADIAGRRVAVPASGADSVAHLRPSELVTSVSAGATLAKACSGRVDAAVIGTAYLPELVGRQPPGCSAGGFRMIDIARSVDIALIARTNTATLADRLRDRIDQIASDGTLVRLSSLHPQLSTAYAGHLSELLQAHYGRQRISSLLKMLSIASSAGLCLTIIVARSRSRLRASNERLSRTLAELELINTAVQESERRYRALVNCTYDWVWETDAQGRYVFAGPQVTDLLGYTPEEILGHTPFDFMPPSEAETIGASFLEIAGERRAFTALENTNIRKDGTLVVLETSGMPILGSSGELLGYQGMDRDITRRKRREECRAAQTTVSVILAGGDALGIKIGRVVEALGQVTRMPFGVGMTIGEHSGSLHVQGIWEQSGEGDLAEAVHLIGSLPRTGLARLCGHDGPQSYRLTAETDACEVARLARKRGFEWMLALPLRAGNETSGVILLFGDEECRQDQPLLETLAVVSAWTGEFIAREQARNEVRRFVAASPTVLYALKVTPESLVPVFVSENLTRLTGHGTKEALAPGWWIDHVHPEDRDRALASSPTPYRIEHQVVQLRIRRADGTYIWVNDERRLLFDENGEPAEVVGAWSDITRRVELENQLLQKQKLEAVGSLAAGVAHDFNNLLTVINGYSSQLVEMLPAGQPEHEQAAEVLRAGERAAGLTRQLLMFSRRKEFKPQPVSLNSLVAGIEKMIRRLIGSGVEFTLRNGSSGKIMADPGQIEQVLVNLIVNAQDAMPDGGRLTVATRDVEIATDEPGGQAGWYAELTVADTGTGMTAEVKDRIFDPFFTTKPAGKGTGLGLSTVYGIARQSGGSVAVDSEPGQGSRFTVLFPLVGKDLNACAAQPDPGDSRGTETILVVEDEREVRTLVCGILRSHGYRVIEAGDGFGAMRIASQVPPPHFDLLLTDVVMPRMSGTDLAERILRLRPATKVLFMTGHSERELAEDTCIRKPFTPGDLARRVRRTLTVTVAG